MNDNNDKKWIGLTFALSGLKEVIRTERNFQIHLIATCLVIVCGKFVRLSKIEWAIILLTISLVLITEIINSVIEKLIDYFKPDIHPKAKVIKDMSASAVLVAAFASIVIGLIIFLPKLFEYI